MAEFYAVLFRWADSCMLNVTSQLCVTSTTQRAFITDLLTQRVKGVLRYSYYTVTPAGGKSGFGFSFGKL